MPFDITESEAELASGFLYEYSSIYFALHVISEYLFILSLIIVYIQIYFNYTSLTIESTFINNFFYSSFFFIFWYMYFLLICTSIIVLLGSLYFWRIRKDTKKFESRVKRLKYSLRLIRNLFCCIILLFYLFVLLYKITPWVVMFHITTEIPIWIIAAGLRKHYISLIILKCFFYVTPRFYLFIAISALLAFYMLLRSLLPNYRLDYLVYFYWKYIFSWNLIILISYYYYLVL